jgi:hypothetical protein
MNEREAGAGTGNGNPDGGDGMEPAGACPTNPQATACMVPDNAPDSCLSSGSPPVPLCYCVGDLWRCPTLPPANGSLPIPACPSARGTACPTAGDICALPDASGQPKGAVCQCAVRKRDMMLIWQCAG